ncbi:McrC family protein [Pseudomonas viridiflava]|uniref:Restriction endonuclease n=2 Tax=Pseudomonas viridiflava TaxID=33069 RepID=A0AA46VVV1_PSEVI|nr:McrC family protein [Pseudomonas viridiflava]UZA68047.1 restriction endonuclease [Pseudomonas viridiflava]
MKSITVREYARLTTSHIHSPTLDIAQVSPSAFDWLCELNSRFSKAGAALVQIEDRRWLKLDNYVGVLETPCGTRIEILPKHFEEGDCIQQSRALLKRMIQKSLDLPTRKVGAAGLERFDAPLTEWVMSSFLYALDHLIKRGMRFDYQRVEEEQRYLRGQLNTARQMRQPPGRQHHFQIRHDVFFPDRPENRLLKTALDIVCKTTQDPSNWRLSHELRSMLLEVPSSRDTAQDFKQWRRDRLMAHYQPVKPWCELIIQQQTPLAVAGEWRGMSLLFPMERLFERYVAACLRDSLPANATLHVQPSSEFLCEHQGTKVFQLRPDMMITQGAKTWVLDTKWKRLARKLHGENYGVLPADLYQMFAYGQKYLGGVGDSMLIYPQLTAFQEMPVFEFYAEHRLWIVSFDLEKNAIGFVGGEVNSDCFWEDN